MVLKKTARLLIKHYKLSKKDAENVAINLENINRANNLNNLEAYKQEIVTLIKSIQGKKLSLSELMTKQEPICYEENFTYPENYSGTNIEDEGVGFIPRNFDLGGGEVI